MAIPHIHITGDPTVDWLNPSQDVDPGTGQYFYAPGQKAPEVQISSQAGGAALLTEFVQHLLPPSTATVQGIKLAPADLTNPTLTGITRAWSTWKRQAGPKDHSAFRIAGGGRYEYNEWDYTCTTLSGTPELLIIDDSGLGFRNHPECWPAALTSPRTDTVAPAEIILKLAQYQSPDKPLPVLDALLHNGLAMRTTVVTSLSDLRACAVRVGISLSWERLMEEIVAAVYHPACPFADPRQPRSLRVKQVLVTVNASGAVLVRPDGNTLIFDRSGQEGDFERQFTGAMMGYNTAHLGAIAAAWVEHGNLLDMSVAARNGVALARELLFGGYTVMGTCLGFPHARLKDALQQAEQLSQSAKPGGVWCLGTFVDTNKRSDKAHPGDWTILEEVIRQQLDVVDISETDLSQAVLTCAADIVRNGPVHAKALSNVPVETVGNWRSADRHEIEGVRSVNNAMRDYLALTRPETPLAIAVFGPPGAGKSFAIKEIARGLGIEKDAQLTFNLSLFESPDELARAFHQIRDMHLKGKMPLVFWDEFDTPCAGKLGWLRHFLAPIQDGVCVDRGMLHHVGGGIYVFAGGTCKSFDEFCLMSGPEDRAAKKPDFVSRLRAYINIKGPNGDPNSIEDPLFMIRRAFLLNNFLDRHATHLRKEGKFAIDNSVVNAFIRTARYAHGARSMESLVRTSSFKGKGSYELSCLPPPHLMSLHVHADDFFALTRSSYRGMLRIGITGHIGLDPEKMAELTSGIARAVQLITTSYPHRTLTVFSPLAKGADRLVAREIFRQHPAARLIAVLPVPADDYLRDFGKTDRHDVDYESAELRQEFRYLLEQRAIEIITMPPSETRNTAYEKVGFFSAEHCDVLIAVWDGKESQGQGGTGDIVQRALEIGKPLIHVWAGNYKADPAKRTEVGAKQGMLRYRNFDEASAEAWVEPLVTA